MKFERTTSANMVCSFVVSPLRLEQQFLLIIHIDFVDKDPREQFLRAENRELMKSLTCMEIDKVFGNKKSMLKVEKYAFLTSAEVKKKFEGSMKTAREWLTVPPLCQIEDDSTEILSKDPELQEALPEKMIFIDSTYGIPDRKRNVWIRHTDGVLETADTMTKRRMLQSYFPLEGRRVHVPKMFFGEQLDEVLNSGKYIFVLDRCLVQFEPYEYDYHRVTSRTYDHINQLCKFNELRSTRHFGAMAFYLAWHLTIDNLVIDCIRHCYMRNAVEAVCLMYNLNGIIYDTFILQQLKTYPKRDDEFNQREMLNGSDSKPIYLQFEIEKAVGKQPDEIIVDEICLDFLDTYQKSEHCQKPNELKQALRTYQEWLNEQKTLMENLKQSHGI